MLIVSPALTTNFDPRNVSFHLALKQDERLFEVMPVRRRPSTRRNVHINQTKPLSSIFPGEQNRIRIAHKPNMRKIITIGSSKR